MQDEMIMNSNDETQASMLTTADNPFNPFTQFDEWFAFDEGKGYHTCAYLARVAKTSDDMSDADQDLAIEQAIAEIVQYNLLGIYKRVTKENFNSVMKDEVAEKLIAELADEVEQETGKEIEQETKQEEPKSDGNV